MSYKGGAVTPAERAEVEAWVQAHQSDGIDLITIGLGAAGVYGGPGFPSHGSAGIAIRYPGRLTDTLEEALANLRSRSGQRTA